MPVVNPYPFQCFHLFTIPSEDYKIIIPTDPFVVVQENQSQSTVYLSKSENIFIYEQNLKSNVETIV